MKTRSFIAAIFSMALFFTLTACGTTATTSNIQTIKGSGTVVTAEREVSGFSSIQLNLGADLSLTQGESENLTLTADDNLMQYIQAKVQNGRLIVSTPENINLNPGKTIQISIQFKTLTAVDVLGSSQVTGEQLHLDTLAITFFGSGSTYLSGTIGEQTIHIAGQANINNFDVSSQKVTVDITGDGAIEVNATETLDITVAGKAHIRYLGEPQVTRTVTGTADIRPIS